MSDYFIKVKGEEKGPYAESQLRSMWNSGIITTDTLFRENESQEWQPISRLLEREQVPATANAPQAPISQPDLPAPAPPKQSQAGAIAFLIILLLIIAAGVFGQIHIISGGTLKSPRIVKKESFGLSETFVNIDTITHMPWISAQSRYPLGCAVLKRERLIESDSPATNTQNPTTRTQQQPQSTPELISDSIEKVFAELDENSVRAQQKYVGNLMRVRGTVETIVNTSVFLKCPNSDQSRLFEVEAMLLHPEEITTLNRGQNLITTGEVKYGNGLAIILKNCTISR